MSASLSDILTTQKNGVIAINNLASYMLGIYNNNATSQLCQSALTTSTATLYTASVNFNSHINYITFCNTTGSAITVSIFIVPSGGTAGTGNAIYYNYSIAANSSVTWSGVQIITAGGTLQGSASSSGVTVTVSGGTST
jgi:hypothetical protein